jgi:catechol 2,3-dioxygenase-like lactoylglutathione lyase family enzyme
MKQRIGLVALVVSDYDEAIAWFAEKLGFELVEDTPQGGKRWVVMAPPGEVGAKLLLAKAVGERQQAAVGEQTGGRVFLFLETDDFERDYALFIARGVVFPRPPRREPYGSVAVFQDLYGNLWDLIQPVR